MEKVGIEPVFLFRHLKLMIKFEFLLILKILI